MIDTPDRVQANGTTTGWSHRGEDLSAAALAQELHSPLAVIWNTVHLLSCARDEATVERVRQVVIRQVEHLSHVVDELAEALRAADDGLGQGPAVAVVLPRADTPAGAPKQSLGARRE